jgi:hypothetical protein
VNVFPAVGDLPLACNHRAGYPVRLPRGRWRGASASEEPPLRSGSMSRGLSKCSRSSGNPPGCEGRSISQVPEQSAQLAVLGEGVADSSGSRSARTSVTSMRSTPSASSTRVSRKPLPGTRPCWTAVAASSTTMCAAASGGCRQSASWRFVSRRTTRAPRRIGESSTVKRRPREQTRRRREKQVRAEKAYARSRHPACGTPAGVTSMLAVQARARVPSAIGTDGIPRDLCAPA